MKANGRHIFAAIDLGAGSGRVIAGVITDGELDIEEVHRFHTSHHAVGELWAWDIDSAYSEIVTGLAKVQSLARTLDARFAGIGVDSWGVDYGLVSQGNVDLSDVRHYRRAGVPADGYSRFRSTPAQRYEATGVLDQSINTVLQLAVRVAEGSLPAESVVLFIPDLVLYLLGGAIGTDGSIASTSQLLDVTTGNWSPPLLTEIEQGAVNMSPLQISGSYAGATSPEITHRIGALAPVPLFRVAGHDTASAFGFAQPAVHGARTSGIVSSGTWSLAGVCLDRAVVSDEARAQGFTTERGLRGFLMMRNLSGMWLVQECARAWADDQHEPSIPDLFAAAARMPAHDAVIDLANPQLLIPGAMPARIVALAAECGRPRPTTQAEIVRVILDSLAAAYVHTIVTAAELGGVTIDDIRVVGGGSLNSALCQATADRSGLTVIAGPVEATAIGNLATQLWASAMTGSIEGAYGMVSRDSWATTTYLPTPIGVHR